MASIFSRFASKSRFFPCGWATATIRGSINTVKIVFLRDFLNTFASKWRVSNGSLREFYFGFQKEEQIIENIYTWKQNAKSYLSDNFVKLRYEDLIGDKKNREQFLIKNFNKKEVFEPDTLNGTKSSFETTDFNHRYKEVQFSKMFKEITNSDKELNNLISELGYNKIESIL